MLIQMMGKFTDRKYSFQTITNLFATRGISVSKKRYWGQHMWARGYLCGTVGEVGQATIAKHIENQGKEENADNFTITT